MSEIREPQQDEEIQASLHKLERENRILRKKLARCEANRKSLEEAKDQYDTVFQSVIRELDEQKELLGAAYGIIKRQRDRMQEELIIARQIQKSMLPSALKPNRKEYTIAAMLEPAREVGGDFFDFFFLDEPRLCLAVGDVSGKGAGSGLFMAAAKMLLKSSSTPGISTAAIVTAVNRELSKNNDSCMFVTLWFAVIDLITGEVVFTNCGHNPPYLLRPGEAPVTVTGGHGPILGILESAEYSVGSFRMEPTDLLFIYTDGVTEAFNPFAELFGTTRLEHILGSREKRSANAVLQATMDAVKEFEKGGLQTDDITILALQYHGPRATKDSVELTLNRKAPPPMRR